MREGELAFFATAAKGTEGALRDELRGLRFTGVRADRGGVHFRGRLEAGYRACLELRTAIRVLLEVGSFEARGERALYDGARALDLGAYVSADTTIAVRASVRSSVLSHSHYVALKTKDAIVDRVRDTMGARPNVDTDDPDVLLSVHLAKDVATVYLDLAGDPLFMRGYRAAQGPAPLKESLAASLIVLSGWKGDEPFFDPMAGSGTIAVEAALIAAKIAPGIVNPRRQFGFERWVSFDDGARRAFDELYDELVERARQGRATEHALVEASDIDPKAIAAIEEHARRAGVTVRTALRHAAELEPREPSTVITNPPYGERLVLASEDKRAIAKTFARLTSSTVGVFTADPSFIDLIPKRWTRYVDLMNGDIPSRFVIYERRSPSTMPAR